MKKQLFTVFGLLLLTPLIFSSCEMAQTKSGWNGLADGAKVPAALAIASGEPRIMLECLDGLRVQLNEGGLSDEVRGEIALDMINLLAVLSKVIVAVGPYLLGEADPADLSDVSDFFDSANENFLVLIAQERLMEAGFFANPAPTQLFWSILGLVLYANLGTGDYDKLSGDQAEFYRTMVDEAISRATVGTNTSFVPLLNQLRVDLGEPVL